jgi:hypothetical protein
VTYTPGVPPNDNIANATAITSFPFVVTQSTWGADQEEFEFSVYDDYAEGYSLRIGATVWYKFVSPITGPVRFNCGDSNYTAHLTVFDQRDAQSDGVPPNWSATGGWFEVSNLEDPWWTYPWIESSNGLVHLNAVQGVTYYIQVAGWYGEVGGLVLTGEHLPPPPPNDNIANATVVPSLPFSVAQSILSSTLEVGEPVPQTSVKNTVWFKYTPSSTSIVRFDTGISGRGTASDTTFLLWVYNDESMTTLVGSSLRLGTYGSFVDFEAVMGTTYYIQVSQQNPDIFRHNFVLNGGYPPPPPSNNDVANATVIPSSLPFVVEQSTAGATLESGERRWNTNIQSTVWFRFISPVTGNVRITTNGSDYDTMLGVYNLALSSTLASNDNKYLDDPIPPFTSPDLVTSTVDVSLQAGTSYYIQVGGRGGVFGQLKLSASLSPGVPANDNIANATLVPSLPFSVAQDNTFATEQYSNPQEPDGRDSVWYRYTATTSTNIRISAIANWDISFDVWYATASLNYYSEPYQRIARYVTERRKPFIDFSVEQGIEYLFRVYCAPSFSSYAQPGEFTITIDYSPPPPLNDNKADATLISSFPTTIVQSTEAATIEPFEYASDDLFLYGDSTEGILYKASVWYKIVAPRTEEIHIAWQCDYDRIVAVWPEPPTRLYDTQAWTINPSYWLYTGRGSFPVEEGKVYYVQVAGWGGAAGTLRISFSGTSYPHVRVRPNLDPATVPDDEEDHFYVGSDFWTNSFQPLPGRIAQYGLDGELRHEIIDSSISATGGAVHPVTGEPWWTNFNLTSVLSCSPDLDPQNLVTRSYTNRRAVESLVFRNDSFYIGTVDGAVWSDRGRMYRYSLATGSLQESWRPWIESRGTDWIALFNDNKTMFYSSESRNILRYDVNARKQLPRFNAKILPSGPSYYTSYYTVLYRRSDNHVFIGSGGRGSVVHLDSDGNIIDEYFPSRPGAVYTPYVFGCALTRDEKEIIVGNFYYYDVPTSNSTGLPLTPDPNAGSHLWRINIATGAGEKTPIATLPPGYQTSSVFSIGGQDLKSSIAGLQKDSLFQFE